MSALTRREACLAAGALSLAAVAPARAQATPEAQRLTRATRVEYATAFAYAQLGGRHAELGRQLAAAEADQAKALVASVEALGAPRPPVVRVVEDATAVVDGLELPPDDRAWLRYAARCELAAIAAHTEILAIVQDAYLLQTSASMLAAAGAHLVSLRRALNSEELPRPFETGRDTL